ncbi:hypothetical protein [Priestia koreensis]|uniref:hypothetical protein n=1 Tax=Priestia koreensis TaxID=284581 RepID=UPI0034587326
MNEHTVAILVRDTFSSTVEACQKLKVQGYVLPVNELWNGVLVHGEEAEIEACAKQISKKIDGFAFFYFHAEDYGWFYQLYKDGEKEAEMYLSYDSEGNDCKRANFSLLRSIASLKEPIHTLQGLEMKQNEAYALNYFKQGFRFEDVRFLSHAVVSGWPIEALAQARGQLIS